jgi:hypothetical protein
LPGLTLNKTKIINLGDNGAPGLRGQSGFPGVKGMPGDNGLMGLPGQIGIPGRSVSLIKFSNISEVVA